MHSEHLIMSEASLTVTIQPGWQGSTITALLTGAMFLTFRVAVLVGRFSFFSLRGFVLELVVMSTFTAWRVAGRDVWDTDEVSVTAAGQGDDTGACETAVVLTDTVCVCVASVSSDDTCDAIGAATWPADTAGAEEAVTRSAGTAGAERAATVPAGTAGSEGAATGPAGTAGAKGTAARPADTTDVYMQGAAVTVGVRTTGVLTNAVVTEGTADLHTGSVSATSLEECVERVKAWKEGLESKGLHVNMTKTKFMASGLGLDILQDSGKFPCAVCRTGVGRSSIRCSKCNLWVHYKKCSGLKTLSEDLSYECPRCRGVPGIRPVDGRPFKEVEVGDCVLEAVDRFCYLGDMLSAGGGCMAAATARCRCAWGKFRENLPLLTSKPVPFDLRGRLFSSNVRSSMLHGTETWPMTSAALHRLCRNDRAMIRWICGVKPSDDPSMDELHAKLGICDLAILVRERRLRWFGHVMRSNGEINRVRSRPVPGRKGPGRPKKTWEECVKQDLKVCGLSEAGTQDRLSWRSSVKNSRQEPTPSNGSLLQSMAAPPARRVLGMCTRSFNKTGFDWLIDWRRVSTCSVTQGTMFSFPPNTSLAGQKGPLAGVSHKLSLGIRVDTRQMFLNPQQIGWTLHMETRSAGVKCQGYGTIGFWFVWGSVFKFELQAMVTTIDWLHIIILFTLLHKSQKHDISYINGNWHHVFTNVDGNIW